MGLPQNLKLGQNVCAIRGNKDQSKDRNSTEIELVEECWEKSAKVWEDEYWILSSPDIYVCTWAYIEYGMMCLEYIQKQKWNTHT